MEDKLKRECKPFLEKLFKKQDELKSGAVSMVGMRKILREMIPEFNQEEELAEMMGELAKKTKYTMVNKQTNKMEVQYQENSIDFPSALYICVYFLKKLERRNTDCFSGKSVVKFDDLTGVTLNPLENRQRGKDPGERRRLY
ncbi:hypothetical protein Ocin01_17002 [Orchesella cincta]|uniref:Uncharacterized protein n=1 Tax=Orchesella cincta TaxID=48709 RepID=A0A1D2M9R1_ORCCI|nr:hypothetical protein Ocin01_17002 [Orchesella cincta]